MMEMDVGKYTSTNTKINTNTVVTPNTGMNPNAEMNSNTGVSAKLNPREMENEPLLEQLGKLAKAERELTAEVIEYIAEVQRRRLYLSQNCTSLYDYLTRRLGYSGSSAQRRIEAARLLLDVPELKDDLKSGELNLSQVGVVAQGLRQQKQQQERTQAQKPPSQQVQQPQPSQLPQQQLSQPQPQDISVVTKPTAELKRELLAQVKGQSVAEAQKTVAGTLNLDVKQGEKRRTQKDGSERVEITFSQEDVAELKRMKDLISHTHLNPTLAEVVMVAVRDFLKRKDPLRSPVRSHDASKRSTSAAEVKVDVNQLSRQQQKRQQDAKVESSMQHRTNEQQPPPRPQSQQNSQLKQKQKREPWPVNTKRAVFQRDQCCQWRDPETNTLCGSTFQLQIDHVQALWADGSNEINNIQLLCSTHNKLKYQMEINRSFRT